MIVKMLGRHINNTSTIFTTGYLRTRGLIELELKSDDYYWSRLSEFERGIAEYSRLICRCPHRANASLEAALTFWER